MRIYQVPAHTRLWLSLAVLLCALPQLLGGPLWSWLLLTGVLTVRYLVERQRMPLPGRWLRVAIVLLTVYLTFQSYGRLYGPEAGVALLVSLFALKYLELVKLRDAYVLIVLGYFVCATGFLFHQSAGMAVYVLLCMLLLTACLVGINHTDTRARPVQHLRLSGTLLLQALPFMLVLFLLVPRIPPLWNMSVEQGQARTGMSDSMSPGQISALSRSAEPAFRVSFEGAVPPPAQRYWRGLTLSYFDGTTWSQALPQGMDTDSYLYRGRGPVPDWFRPLAELQEQTGYRYQVMIEPTQRRWLYALAVPVQWQGNIGASLARDQRLVADNDVTERSRYQVHSVSGAASLIPLDPAEQGLLLSLPEHGGNQARRLARQWRQQADSDQAVVDQALRYFREQPFYYTLEPPRLLQDSIDQFLFSSRRGFCEHYASSFTFLMRAAGIPARVVVGYQGGEFNPQGEHLLVRQYDAHAWAEVWLPEQGWVEVDPTAAVAPERIEQGLAAALEAQGESDSRAGLNLEGFAREGLFWQVQAWRDAMDYRWHSWVLGYDTDSQLALLGRWLGEVTIMRMALLILAMVGGLLALLVLFWWLRQPRSRLTVLEREFWLLFETARGHGLPLVAGTTATELSSRIAAHWPALAGLAGHWRQSYQQHLYRDDGSTDKQSLRHLRQLRRRLQKGMKESAFSC